MKTVNVTREDIRDGKPHWISCCAAALAMRRAFPRHRIIAGVGILHVGKTEYPTPRAVTTFMRRFDAGTPVEPFSFQLK